MNKEEYNKLITEHPQLVVWAKILQWMESTDKQLKAWK